MKFRLPFLLALGMLTASMLPAQPVVTSLTTDYRTNPLGIDAPAPKLGWKIREAGTCSGIRGRPDPPGVSM
jgi:hypothetical protein